jgi:flagellar biosynthetic protein FlhB
MSDKDLKTEQPTEKKLAEALDEGQFARTGDIPIVFVLTAGFFTLAFSSREYCEKIFAISVGIFGHLGKYKLQAEAVNEWTLPAAMTMLGLMLPVAVACAGAGALAGGLQSRFRLTPKAIGFKFSRLNPASGFKRIFSMQGLVKLATDAAKLVIVGFLVWGAVKDLMHDPIFYTPVPPMRLGGFMLSTATMLLGRFVLALGGIAALNYIYQLRKVQGDLMMSKQEVKEEHRNAEGDPHVKGLRRQMARRYAQKQMLEAVPTADVVVTNPTHFAVALRYERGTDKAPVVLAKGENAFAKRIKALAAENGVPMVENRPVARALFKYGRVGKAIPLELYQAVADILAFVYKTHRYYFHQLRARRAGLA